MSDRGAAGRRGGITRIALTPSLPVVLGCLLAAVVLTTDLLLSGPMSRLDDVVSDQIGGWGVRESAVGYPIAWAITQIGGQRVLILAVMAVLVSYLCWTRKTLQPLARTVVALLLLTGAVYAFKYGLGRTAPAYPGGSFLFRDAASYPSGHTANAVLMWGVSAWLAVDYGLPARVQQVFAVLFVGSPIASGVTMVLLNFHWFTDILTGAAVGLILLWIVHRIFSGPLGSWTGIRRARGVPAHG